MEVYSLVSSAKRYSPDFTQLPPGNRTCSFISHLKSPGSIQPGCHFRRTALFKHTSLHCPTRYPLTPGSRECTCEQSALPRSTTSKHIQRSRGSNPRSLASKLRTLPLSHDAPQNVTPVPSFYTRLCCELRYDPCLQNQSKSDNQNPTSYLCQTKTYVTIQSNYEIFTLKFRFKL